VAGPVGVSEGGVGAAWLHGGRAVTEPLAWWREGGEFGEVDGFGVAAHPIGGGGLFGADDDVESGVAGSFGAEKCGALVHEGAFGLGEVAGGVGEHGADQAAEEVEVPAVVGIGGASRSRNTALRATMRSSMNRLRWSP